MVDQSSTFSDGTCENFDFQVFESSFEGYQVAVRVLFCEIRVPRVKTRLLCRFRQNRKKLM
jgi:hypothetical protein